MFEGLRTVQYHVADLTAARAWYTEALGQEPYFDQPFYVGFNVGGYELGLLPGDGVESEKATGVVAYWGVKDTHAAFERLIALGAAPHENPKDVGHGITKASVFDPYGNLIGVMNNPHFRATDAR